MKIDWSKWVFKISDDWAENVNVINTETDEKIFVGKLNKFKDGDDPVKIIKDKVKDHITAAEIQKQIKKWKNQTIPVEDNLDYIENEAEKRGLI